MIDCAENGNFGCDGGDICSLLSWLIKKKVEIFPEVSYPLTRRTEQCKFNKCVFVYIKKIYYFIIFNRLI